MQLAMQLVRDERQKSLVIGGQPVAAVALAVLRESAEARDAWNRLCVAAIAAAELWQASKEGA